ncbi:MAG: GDSL-like Lipase/Acylhydrolase [Lentisphaerae bacterium ADurb.Bin242]|nr:MAG: GDSL-like Lipase/Acylhydrolase [Lentisphaerae bacterium ADurb.Bin242]
MLKIKSGDKILFTGDSITDCGCSASENINFLGHGYPVFIAALLGARKPELELTFVNTGISGHRVCDLKGRWERDVINHKPNVVSILIGINDVASRYSCDTPKSALEFEEEYRFILEKTRKELPGTGIILMEPFVLPLPEDRRLWRDDLDKKLQVVRDLAAELADVLIPLDGIFNTAACRREKSFWTPDGVHPTPAGHALIAENWIASVSF